MRTWRTPARHRGRLLVVLAVLVAALGWAGLPAGGSPTAPGTGAAEGRAAQQDDARRGPADVVPADGQWTVTLLTGEVVDVRSDAEGRAAVQVRDHDQPYRSYREPSGDVYVVPLAVTSLVDRVLDRELFNVTGLVRQRLDDASVDTVRLIVQREPGVDLRARVGATEAERPLPSIGAVATAVPKDDATAAGDLLAELADAAEAAPRAEAAGGIAHVWLDGRVTALASATPAAPAGRAATRVAAQAPAELDRNLVQVGADDAWAAGFRGDGVTIGVLDTGVDATHPDLAGRVDAAESFVVDLGPEDRHGHGTHVASIAAGTGAGSGGARSGVAPGARLVSGRVVDDEGYGFESDAIAGMEWAAPQADVVNMSLGFGWSSDGSDPMSLALDALSDQHDTLFVVSAGNEGPGAGSVSYPGAADRALTVGAVDGEDALAGFSSRGPLAISGEVKPELVAPGVDIVAARAAGTTIGDPVGDLYTTLSGTSMAAPHAAGAAADLAQRHPEWTAPQLKAALTGTTDPVAADTFDAGAGRLDVGDAVAAAARPGADVLDLALPHPRTEPHTEALTWANTGDTPVTLALDATLEDRDGEPAAAVAVEPAELTIAPGATGSATLVVDGPALRDGRYDGVVTADPAGDAPDDDIRTAVGLHARPETTTLTIEPTAPAGPPGTPASGFAAIVEIDEPGRFAEGWYVSGPTEVEVPVGRYAVIGDVATDDTDSQVTAQVGVPDVEVRAPTTVVLDGPAAVPFTPTVQGVATAPPMGSAAYATVSPGGDTDGGFLVGAYAWHPQPAVRVTPWDDLPDEVTASQTYRLQAPDVTARVGGEDLVLTSVEGHLVPLGDHRLTAVDAGDGADLSGAGGALAIVQLPAADERAAVTERAAAAGVAALAFVDEGRQAITIGAFGSGWADVPVVLAAGDTAAALRAAATSGERVRLTSQASPYVYDIVSPPAGAVDPTPVLGRSDQRALATLRERFHRDPGGHAPVMDRRYPISHDLMNLDSVGHLPESRTAYVTPGVTWQSMAVGFGYMRIFGEILPTDKVATSMDSGVEYPGGRRTDVAWLDRPTHPGPVGAPAGASACQPTPVTRTPSTLQVWLTPFQDGPDRFSCADPHEARLTLERDGEVIGSADENYAEVPMPDDAGTYRLTYTQRSEAPYAARSETAWTFASEAPEDDELVPLLVVDYDLPLDTQNRPTGRRATLTAHQVTGTEAQAIESLEAWTSVDDGATWQPARAERVRDGRFEVTLPRAATGTPVSLRVDATDEAGNRIEQTLHQAYTA
jgi:subtilisin family serine protease